MNFSLFIGLRYLFSKRKEGYLSLISWFSFVGIILGVIALIVVLSVMNGFHKELRDRILSVVPHAFVEIIHTSPEKEWQQLIEPIKNNQNVIGVAPYIQGKALISSKQQAIGVQLNGVLPEVEPEVSVMHRYIEQGGNLDALQADQFQIIIGRTLANQLNVRVGDSVKVLIPKVSVTPAGIFPRSREFIVAGIFEVGSQIDHEQAFVHIHDARLLFRIPNQAQGVQVRLNSAFDISDFAQNLDPLIKDNYKLITWQETHSSLFSAVKMEKTIVGFLLAMVIAVATFNIISILSMMVSNKRSEIAVLRTMGASAKQIMYIFITYGMSMAVLGVIIGTLIGIPFAYFVGDVVDFFERHLGMQIFDPSVYYISSIPSVIQISDVLWVVGLTLILVLLVCIYPALKASQVEPAQALQYE